MLFNSIDFLIFFPVTVAVFFFVPRKLRSVWLLAASYYFYMSWNPKYALLIAFVTLISWCSGLALGSSAVGKNLRRRKMIIAADLVCCLGILFVFKYAGFFTESVCRILSRFGIYIAARRPDLLLPVGISFYTFQTLSYTIDVYRGTTSPERNPVKYALFVSFFPQLVAGPIERSGNLLKQIRKIESLRVWDPERIKKGFLLMMWGLFQKMVIADRASIAADHVLRNYRSYGFVELSAAMILFAFQIYCDFGGYTNIARGAAQVMGFSLMQNFRQPYFARSIKDFWRRWHISLTGWFTDYLYIPLGGNRKGTMRKWLNILIVFAVSGLWHGADWSFVVWGLIHAVLQITEDMFTKLSGKSFAADEDVSLSRRIAEASGTFVLTDLAWIFFACGSIRQAGGVLIRMAKVFVTSRITDMGLSRIDWQILITALLILMLVDILHERHISIHDFMARQQVWFRWAAVLGLVWAVIMFGVYGMEYDAGTFIYFQF